MVDPATTTFVLPRYFGSRTWSVPTTEIAVLDLTAPLPEPAGGAVVFDPPLRTEQLWTTDERQRPTTMLAFRTPQPVPPIRLLAHTRKGIRWRESRSAAGVRLDGVGLTFVDPAAAHRTLVANGAEMATDGDAGWRRWRPHRPFDDLEHEAIGMAVRILRRDLYVSIGVFFLAGLVALPARIDPDLWPVLAPAVAIGIGGQLLTRRARRRLAEREDQAAAAARQRLGRSPAADRPGS